MRIGIDVRYLSHGLMGGVHTYVSQLIPALLGITGGHAVYLYADTKGPLELQSLPDHATVSYLPWRNPLSSIYNDFAMRRLMARDHLDVVHFPANYGFAPRGTRTVITLHDAINILPLREIVRGHPKNARTLAMMSYLHFCTLMAVPRADLLLTVSAHAAQQIAHYGGFDARKIVSIPEAPAPDLERIENGRLLTEVRRRYDLTRAFVLADALKNPMALIRAWQLLPSTLRDNKQMVFFSRQSNLTPVLQESVAKGDARLIIRPSREDLAALYSMAEAFVFPSWVEGFGLPVLEAMSCGAPVIASNRGSIPEVAGTAALLIDAEDAATLALHLVRVLTNPAEAERLRRFGFARAAQFSWPQTAQRVLECYEQAVNEKAPSPSFQFASGSNARNGAVD